MRSDVRTAVTAVGTAVGFGAAYEMHIRIVLTAWGRGGRKGISGNAKGPP